MKPRNILVLPLASLLLAPPASAQAPKKKKAPTGETQVVSLSQAAEPKPAPAEPPAPVEEGPTLQETKDFVLVRLRKQVPEAEISGNVISNYSFNEKVWYYVDVNHLELSLLNIDGGFAIAGITFVPKSGKSFPPHSGYSNSPSTRVRFVVDNEDAGEVVKAIRYWGKLIGNTQKKLKFD